MMENKTFAFHGLEFWQIFVFVVFLILITLIGFLFPIYVLERVSGPALPTFFALMFGGLFAVIFGRLVKKLWRINLTGEFVEIYFGKSLKAKFVLSDLKKIQIRGRDRKKTYKILRLFTNQQKISIFVDNTGGITDDHEMKVVEEWRRFLEGYAEKNKYQKIDLRKKSAPQDFINYALQRS